MSKLIKSTVFLICAFLCTAITVSGQKITNDSGAGYDSLATANAKGLASNYLDAMNTLFNQPLTAIDAEAAQYTFSGLFDEAAFVFHDYTIEKDFRNPSDYYHYANKWFRDVNPVYEGKILWESLELEYYEIDDYYIGKIQVENNYNRLLNLTDERLEEQTQTGMLTLEMKIGETPLTSAIIMVEEFIPPVTASVEPEQEKPEKEKKEKEEKVKKPKNNTVIDHSQSILVFASFGPGGNLGLTQFTSESDQFEVKDQKNSSFSLSVNGLIPISQNGLYVSAGLGFTTNQLELTYNNTEYSFDFTDDNNPAANPAYGNPAIIDEYTRTVELSDLVETINYQDLTLQLMLSKNLANPTSNKFVFVSGGFSLGIPVSQTVSLSNSSDYYGHFDEINGNPANLTLGKDEEVPEYGFTRQNTQFDFEFDSKPIFNAALGINAGLAFAQNVYAGIGIEGLIPLNNWLEGTADHDRVFETSTDLEDSLANTVIKSNRPIRLGISAQLGIFF